MTDKACNVCAFFDNAAVKETSAKETGGLCRFSAPTFLTEEEMHGDAHWPVVKSNDWCGSFEGRAA
ncbi:hypothetical protein J7382_14580 [Shimia sp. R11_0]|uniref:hypothetical protein n=1 Tax=Shimia sp. R11_0 TaxID=2821096 RepID=UPI001ADB52D9|nr:hypothetical protein [Shimia sp. R11_0]MBO9478771.1 hypothetical protein [Shimia sp. R11_0]